MSAVLARAHGGACNALIVLLRQPRSMWVRTVLPATTSSGLARRLSLSAGPSDTTQLQLSKKLTEGAHLIDAVKALLICFSAEDQQAAGHQRH